MGRPTLLFLVTEDWYFWSHRAGLAQAARDAGYDVVLASRFTDHRGRIEALGIRCIPLPFARSMRNPLHEWRVMRALAAIVRRTTPVIVHAVALKPILLCTWASWRAPQVDFCHAITGLGHLFISDGRRARIVRAVVVPTLRWLFGHPRSWLIVQNEDDLALLTRRRIAVAARSIVIPGAGVDVARFAVTPLPSDDPPCVVLPARMLRDKGVLEFAEAARRVRARGVPARFVLVGGVDPDNPAALTEQEIAALCADGCVEWWRHQDDMPAVYARASLVCLPSYREGFPKVLLEAAACGRPMIATDVPGCREICRDGVTGVQVPVRDGAALAEACVQLLNDRARRVEFGRNARILVEREFADELVNRRTLDFYARIVAGAAWTGDVAAN
ncbi:MAG: glycosyltransferase family 4 protein [Gammaproteobacteria bacterium]